MREVLEGERKGERVKEKESDREREIVCLVGVGERGCG